ncbi:site-specific integrase [bacterium]|nr:site-specific integrase [bacterium]
MATYRKRNGKWQAIVRNKDIGTIAKTFTNKTTAIRWASEQELRLEEDKFGKLLPEEVTLADLLSRYRDEITPQKRGAPAELRRLNRLISDPISQFSVNKLSSQILAQFRDRRIKDGQRACQYDLVLIRHCLKVATYEWGLLLERNPVDLVKLPPSPKARERRLLPSEFANLTSAVCRTSNPHVWPVVEFALETAMRRGEILALKWQDVCLEERIARLHLTKNGTSRDVPLSSTALGILIKQKAKRASSPFPINDNAFRLAWDRLKKRAGVTNLRFHDMRHEAISRLFEQGLNIAEVAMISGHKDPRMLFRYTHLKAKDVLKKLN